MGHAIPYIILKKVNKSKLWLEINFKMLYHYKKVAINDNHASFHGAPRR